MSESETAGELLARLGTDGGAWAQEFSYTLARRAIAAGDGRAQQRALAEMLVGDPGGMLHGWFANAIEAGRSAGYAEAKREDHGPDWPLGHADLGARTRREEPSELRRAIDTPGNAINDVAEAIKRGLR